MHHLSRALKLVGASSRSVARCGGSGLIRLSASQPSAKRAASPQRYAPSQPVSQTATSPPHQIVSDWLPRAILSACQLARPSGLLSSAATTHHQQASPASQPSTCYLPSATALRGPGRQPLLPIRWPPAATRAVDTVCEARCLRGLRSSPCFSACCGSPCKQNSRKGSDQRVAEFLGCDGAVVVGVEVVGNQLAMLLRNAGGEFRVLRWNLRQGGALDWFEYDDGRFAEYPASSERRNAANFELAGLHLPPEWKGKDIRLVEVDCTSTPNQAEWELRETFPNLGNVPFSPAPGWFARYRGVPNMLLDPNGWVEAVVACALVVAARYPDRPVVVWIGRSTVWEATGFKSKGDLLIRNFMATGRPQCLTMGELVADGPIAVMHLCWIAYLFLYEELAYAYWYDLTKFNAPKIMNYAINVLLVFQKKDCVQLYHPGKYRHDQFWAPKAVLETAEWKHMVKHFGWRAKPPLGANAIDGFCAKVGVGPLAWHQHIDVVNIPMANRALDLLRGLRGEGGTVKKLPKVADRPAIIAELGRARREEEARRDAAEATGESSGDETADGRAGSESAAGPSGSGPSVSAAAPAAGKRKRRHKNRKNYGNRLERIHASYTNGTWWQRALDIMSALDRDGLGGMLPDKKFELALSHMQKS
ncbi:hypothetical protein KFL_011020010 [Klebsormidium nitens]|uniref:Uncharacterized protein n=1 Tax=Klebsormidium nitens TaxID=105231 RepID=A0A1Y1IWR8_KLENI|nr:hypothetical protein KFL_011020010 [Klebsormidium nitens]|eukprot:GAQ92708.1 hypothetical protein KFL_011020010 [Klebsormidium nitens]